MLLVNIHFYSHTQKSNLRCLHTTPAVCFSQHPSILRESTTVSTTVFPYCLISQSSVFEVPCHFTEHYGHSMLCYSLTRKWTLVLLFIM